MRKNLIYIQAYIAKLILYVHYEPLNFSFFAFFSIIVREWWRVGVFEFEFDLVVSHFEMR